MKNLYLVILALLALLIGCLKQFLNDDNRLTITAFSTSFDTKASETAFESGDVMGVFMENNASNLRYETSDGVSWKGYGNLTQFKAGDNVIAYYPYSETATSMNAIEVASGVDFMITEPTPITVVENQASAALNFKHVLSKLVVSMEIPSEIAGIKTASLESITVKNVFRKGVIDITTKAIAGLTDVGDVVLTSGEAIIIPQTISRIEFSFKMANGTTEKLAHTKDLTLTSGNKTTLQAISNTDIYFNSFLDLKNGDAQTDLPLSFYVAPGRTWTLTSSAAWLTLSATTGVGAATAVSTTRSVSAVFATANSTITRTWSGTQEQAGPPTVVNIDGKNWRTANLGATNPQDYGNFYKWGSTYAYPRVRGKTPSGHWGGETTGSGSYPNGDPCKSLGAYKTPTHEQWVALVNSGNSSWTTYQGKNGYFFGPKATSLTVQDGSIFLPAAGLRNYYNGFLYNETTSGYYWSSSVYDANGGWYLDFNHNGYIRPDHYNRRGSGLSVRCVQE